jgi:hypothetical protein
MGSEDDIKLDLYGQIGVAYYVVYDPYGYLSKIPLRVYVRAGRNLISQAHHKLDGLGLGLTIWEGTYAGCTGRYLRFLDESGNLLLTGEESARAARSEAEQAKSEAQQAKNEAQQAKSEAEQAKTQLEAERIRRLELERKLAELGLEP